MDPSLRSACPRTLVGINGTSNLFSPNDGPATPRKTARVATPRVSVQAGVGKPHSLADAELAAPLSQRPRRSTVLAWECSTGPLGAPTRTLGLWRTGGAAPGSGVNASSVLSLA